MKKALFILALIFTSGFSYGQNWEWARGVGSTANIFSNGPVTDPAGNVFVAGSYTTSVTFGTTTLNTSSNTIFLVKYDPVSNVVWAKGANGGAAIYSMASDAIGNIYIAGLFGGPVLSFGNIQISSIDTQTSEGSMFIAKYDNNGNVVWAKSVDDSLGIARPYGLTVDAANNVYMSGEVHASCLKFDGLLLTCGNTVEGFLVKYDLSGNPLWAKAGGGASTCLTADNSGNIYVTGLFNTSSATFGTITLAKSSSDANSKDMYLVKYDTSGNAIWGRNNLCGAWGNHITVSTDPMSNIYVAGGYASNLVVYGNDTLPYGGALDAFVAKYDGQGNVVWGKGFGGADRELAKVMCDHLGNVYISGTFESASLSIDNYTLTNVGGLDIMFAALDTSGNITYATSAGGAETEAMFVGRFITADYLGNIYITGGYASPSLTFAPHIITGSTNPNRYYMFLAKWPNPQLKTYMISQTHTLTIYPNPTDDNLTIETSLTNYTLSLLNTLGQVVERKVVSGSKKTTLNVEPLNPGVYYLRLETLQGETMTRKVIVQH